LLALESPPIFLDRLFAKLRIALKLSHQFGSRFPSLTHSMNSALMAPALRGVGVMVE
jgi:hypothetical protein